MYFVIGLLPSKPAIKRTSTALLDSELRAIPVMIGLYGNSEKRILRIVTLRQSIS